jgi:hypothetical protein
VGEPAPAFVSTERTKRFEKAVANLQGDQSKALKKQLAHLYQNPKHPSLKVHQIDPDKYYWEAYLNRGDRIIYIPEGTHLVLVDIVNHDDISRYGRRPRNK